jgi:septum site-determining protein MinD
MPKIISVHSYRGGTGKSNTTANIATLLAAKGQRVGVMDTDMLSGGTHVLFGLKEDEIVYSFNDFLSHKCAIQEIAHNVTRRLDANISGEILVITRGEGILTPAGQEASPVPHRENDVTSLNDGYQRIIDDLDLDILIIDTQPGLNDETLFAIAIADALIIVMRPDQQDYQGTGVTVEIAKKLGVPQTLLVVNKVPPTFDLYEVKARIEEIYHCQVGGILPHSIEMMALASTGIFVLRFPNHPITLALKRIATLLLDD